MVSSTIRAAVEGAAVEGAAEERTRPSVRERSWCWMRWILARSADDRGDVPGWVLVTMMTAGLVAGLWAIAGDALNDLFRQAIAGVAP